MAHYALIDENNIVVQVITGVDENIIQTDLDGTQVGGSSEAWEEFYASRPWFLGLKCKRTSYNSIGGKWRNPETNIVTDQPGFRKNFAGIGFIYDEEKDAFIPPMPEQQEGMSFWLNPETCRWRQI
jgi:hypothetical protein